MRRRRAPPRGCARSRAFSASPSPRRVGRSKVQSITATCFADVVEHAVVHAVGQHRAFQHEHVGLRLVLGEDVAEVLEARAQAHHALFAQRVDRRVGDLREILPEEVRQRPVVVRQNGERRSHRPSSRWLPCRLPPWARGSARCLPASCRRRAGGAGIPGGRCRGAAPARGRSAAPARRRSRATPRKDGCPRGGR